MLPSHQKPSLGRLNSLSTRSFSAVTLTTLSSHRSPGSSSPFDFRPAFRGDPVDEDSIFVTHVRDDEHPDPMFMSAWRRWAARLVGLTAIPAELLGLFLYRYQLNILRELEAFGGWDIVPRVNHFVLYAIFCIGLIEVVQGFAAMFIKIRVLFSRFHPRLYLLGDNVPSVDIFVTVCNEDLDIVRDTVMAALNIDYPRHRFRVIVADDGNTEKLQAWVGSMATEYPTLYYYARSQKGGWKAGNLNHARRFVESLPGGAAECMAGLDADMIPEPRWLRAVTAHLMRDSKMGLVCPAQMFYNIPSDDPLQQTNALDWRFKSLMLDLAGIGLNYGSGWVMRSQVFDDIGGFPEDAMTEDICSALMAMSEGWKTMYIREGLQYGLVPETYVAQVKQQTRWCVGGCQASAKFGFFPSKNGTKHLGLSRRWILMCQGFCDHVKLQADMATFFLTCVLFLTDTPLAYWKDQEQMRFLLRMSCALVLLRWLQNFQLAILAGYRYSVGGTTYISPYNFISYLKFFVLPKQLGGKAMAFTPTGSIGNKYRERDPLRRAPLWQRLRHMVVDTGVWFHLLVLTILLTGILLRTARAVNAHLIVTSEIHRPDWEAFWIQILQTVAWPSNPWFIPALSCLVPLQYAVFPPTTPDRDELMGKRDRHGVRYPAEEVRGKVKRSRFSLRFVELYSMYMLLVLAVFILA